VKSAFGEVLQKDEATSNKRVYEGIVEITVVAVLCSHE